MNHVLAACEPLRGQDNGWMDVLAVRLGSTTSSPKLASDSHHVEEKQLSSAAQ